MSGADNLRVVTRIFLIRHAHSIANEKGVLAGRTPGITLSEQGHNEAKVLASRLKSISFEQIRISPMQRCHETIAPFLNSSPQLNLTEFSIDDRLNEVDYGSWSGKKLSNLARQPLWKSIQENPQKVQFPDGERMASMHRRSIDFIDDLVASASKGPHLVVSHGDVLKAMIAYMLNMKFNDFQKLIIDPASVTIFDYDKGNFKLSTFNDTSTIFDEASKKLGKNRALLGGGSGLKRKFFR